MFHWFCVVASEGYNLKQKITIWGCEENIGGSAVGGSNKWLLKMDTHYLTEIVKNDALFGF